MSKVNFHVEPKKVLRHFPDAAPCNCHLKDSTQYIVKIETTTGNDGESIIKALCTGCSKCGYEKELENLESRKVKESDFNLD